MSYFFRNPQKGAEQKLKKPQNSPQHRRPSPQKQPAQCQEPQNAPQKQAQTGIDSKQALAGINRKQQKAGHEDQAEQQIQQPRQARTQTAQAPQHIIEHAQQNAQGHRLGKLPRLG